MVGRKPKYFGYPIASYLAWIKRRSSCWRWPTICLMAAANGLQQAQHVQLYGCLHFDRQLNETVY